MPTTPPQVRVPTTGPRPSSLTAAVTMSPSDPANSSATVTIGRRGPMVTVADEFAGSDGDIVTAAVKLLGLGPVVGTRTWGGVVGIDGVPGHELVDGTHMTVPRYAFSFDEYGWGVENYGVDPDVEVLLTPDDWAAGHDPQLETAVRLVLEALEKQPPKVPADPATGPSRVRPPLPPRDARAPRGTA